MPYKIEDEGSCFKVVNKETGKVHAKCTTKEKAEAQIKLLRGIDHGMKTESNIDRVLNILVEKDEIITKDLFDQALKVGMTRSEISKYSSKPDALEKLVQRKREAKWKEQDKESAKQDKQKEKETTKNRLTDKQFDKICKDSASSWKDDNEDNEQSLGQVAPDIADSMLYDPKIVDYVKYKLGSEYSKQRAKEYVADSLMQ